MLGLFVSLCLMLGTWAILRGGFAGDLRGWRMTGFDSNALGLGAVAIIAAIWYFGWVYGITLILAVMLHEFGHVAAFRVCGHTDARFRLIPLLGGVAISSRIPASHDRQVFISLMGPAICLAPMCLSFALADLMYSAQPFVAAWLNIFATVLATLNFLNLLPLWPFDGGRIVQVLIYAISPKASRTVSIIMSGLALVAAIKLQSFLLMFVVATSVRGLFMSEQLTAMQRPMTGRTAITAGLAYAATTGAFLTGAQRLLGMLL